MNKNDFFNVLDFGSSKIRFSVYDNKFKEKYFNSVSINIHKDNDDHLNIINI